MRTTFLFVAILLLAAVAFAQQQPPQQQQLAVQTRIEQQIGALAVQNTSLMVQVEQLQAALKAAQETSAKCVAPEEKPKP